MLYVYIVRSLKTKRYYIGSGKDPAMRLRAHNCGKTRSLKNQGPFELVRVERYDTRTQARKRELQIKRYKGGRAFQRLLNSTTVPVV